MPTSCKITAPLSKLSGGVVAGNARTENRKRRATDRPGQVSDSTRYAARGGGESLRRKSSINAATSLAFSMPRRFRTGCERSLDRSLIVPTPTTRSITRCTKDTSSMSMTSMRSVIRFSRPLSSNETLRRQLIFAGQLAVRQQAAEPTPEQGRDDRPGRARTRDWRLPDHENGYQQHDGRHPGQQPVAEHGLGRKPALPDGGLCLGIVSLAGLHRVAETVRGQGGLRPGVPWLRGDLLGGKRRGRAGLGSSQMSGDR